MIAARVWIFLAVVTLSGTSGWAMQGGTNDRAAFAFADVEYFHRYTVNDQHEYTPAGQEDLKRWTDMVTIHYYRKTTDGEMLATVANGVLENYKKHKAMVLKTSAVPRTREKPAEHVIVVVFPAREFMEAAFARLRMHEGIGTGVIYSHRVYGRGSKVGNEMSAWLLKNGAATEQALMQWNAVPERP